MAADPGPVAEMQALEMSLLHTDFRAAGDHLEALLAPDFREVAANGALVSRQQVIDWILQKDPAARWSFKEPQLVELAPDVRLFSYHARQILPEPSGSKGSRNCSVWRYSTLLKCWQLAFHQATRLS